MEPGTTVGRYTLIERLGAGGMATVWRARETDGEQHHPVAVKILPVHLAASDTLRQRFLGEAKMVARLRHPHILPVYDFGEDDGMPFIVMKLAEGGTLDDFIHEELLPLRAVARVLVQVAAGLDHAHQQGVIHRDIKPENILFDSRGIAYLADFGIARLHEGSEHITGSGGFIGTAAYASPEQCRGEEITPASDIYSLGIVLYEMLTGVLPFQGPTPLAIMHKHISEPVPNPLKDRSDLPLGITEVMRKALAKLPQVRYQTALAMSGALNEALRTVLGTKPLAENAPPLGPNPVFNGPAGASPLPMPDELLRSFAPTRPTPPPSRDGLTAQVADGPLPDAPRSAPAPAASPPSHAESDLLVLALLVVTVLVAAAVVAAVFLSR
jgi:serine/threonine protein kinase